MERKIPKLNASILRPLIGSEEDQTEKNYIKEIQKFERSCENSLIRILSGIGTTAIVKTDPYSLPYNREIIVNLNGESYLNGPYEFHRVARVITREILGYDLYKIRFYIFIEIDTDYLYNWFGDNVEMFSGRVTYKFRYHIRKERQ